MTSLVKSRPDLLPLLVQLAADKAGEKGHSEACLLHACWSSVDLLHRIMQCKALKPLVLNQARTIGPSVKSLLSHAKALVKDQRQGQNREAEPASVSIDELNEMIVRLEQVTIDLGI